MLSQYRGITVTSNGGTIYGQVVNAPIAGDGKITKVSGQRARPQRRQQHVVRRHRRDERPALPERQRVGRHGHDHDAPDYLVTLGKNEGPDSTVSNAVQMAAGSLIELRVFSDTSPVVGSIYQGQQTGSLTLAGKISGPGNIVKGLVGTQTYFAPPDFGTSTVRPADGAVVLSNSTNDFTGNVTITRGMLVAAANNALGSTAGSTAVNNTGTLGFQGNINYTAAETVHIAGTGLANVGAVRNVAGDNTFAGPVRLTGDAAIDVSAGSLNLSAGVGGAAVLTKTGGNDLTVKNVRTNGLTITGGSVSVTTNGGPDGTSVVKSLSIGGGHEVEPGRQRPDRRLHRRQRRRPGPPVGEGRPRPGVDERDLLHARAAPTTTSSWPSPTTRRGARATFNGINIDTDTVVGKYTYFGDANLDGKVTGDDYVSVDANLGTGDSLARRRLQHERRHDRRRLRRDRRQPRQGHADAAGVRRTEGRNGRAHVAMFGEEYLVLLAAAEAEGFGASVVPEPAAISLIGLGAVGLLGRRRRSR